MSGPNLLESERPGRGMIFRNFADFSTEFHVMKFILYVLARPNFS